MKKLSKLDEFISYQNNPGWLKNKLVWLVYTNPNITITPTSTLTWSDTNCPVIY